MIRVSRFAFLPMLVLTAALLAGCAPQKAGKAVNLEFWHYLSEEQSKPLKDLIAEYEKANDGVSIKAVFQGNPRELKQKLDSSFAAATANNPVMATMYESWTDDFNNKGYMEPVQNYFDGPDGLSKEEQKDIVKVFRDGNSWNGKMMTMPFNKSVYMLYVNADKLAKAGLTTAPTTQAEFANAVKKLTTRDDGRISTYGFGVQPRSEAFTIFYFARGGRIFDEAGNPKFDSPEAIETMTLLRDLQYPEKHLYVNPDYMSTPFGNQQIAMYSYSSASFPYNKKLSAGKFNYQAAAIPGVEGKDTRYLMQGTNIGIFGNRSEAERRAAWKFLKFLTTAKNSAMFSTRAGYMPIRYSVLKEPVMQEYMAQNADYALASSLVLGDKGIQEPKIAIWEGLRSDIDSVVDNVLSKGSDPKEELTALQAKAVQKVLQKKQQ
ncbi:MAG: ABC transporter substrate-binding protein [Candidatus Sumerlaeaceae bacterium]